MYIISFMSLSHPGMQALSPYEKNKAHQVTWLGSANKTAEPRLNLKFLRFWAYPSSLLSRMRARVLLKRIQGRKINID